MVVTRSADQRNELGIGYTDTSNADFIPRST